MKETDHAAEARPATTWRARLRWLLFAGALAALALVLLNAFGLIGRGAAESRTDGNPFLKKAAKAQNPRVPRLKLKKSGAEAVPELINKLKEPDTRWDELYEKWWNNLPARVQGRLPHPDEEEAHRQQAILLLRDLGADAKAAAPWLVAITQLPRPPGRPPTEFKMHYDAVDALARIDGDNRNTVLVLVGLQRDTDPGMREIASRLLSGLPLAAADPEIRARIVKTLEEPGRMNGLAHLGLFVRIFDPNEMEMRAELLRFLTHPAHNVRRSAAGALGGARTAFEEIVPALVLALGDETTPVYPEYSTERRLHWNIGGEGRKASVTGGQGQVTLALASLSAHTQLVAVDLEKALQSAPENELDRYRQAMAAGVLGLMEERGRPALPTLRALEETEDERLRYFVAESLWRLDDDIDAVIPYRLLTIRDTNIPASRRRAAIVFFGDLGDRAKPAIPALIAVVRKKGDLATQATAIVALGKIGAVAEDAIPALRLARAEPYFVIQAEAGKAINRIYEDLRLEASAQRQ